MVVSPITSQLVSHIKKTNSPKPYRELYPVPKIKENITNEKLYLYGDSIELHCASFLRIISYVISALSQRVHIDNLTGFIRGYEINAQENTTPHDISKFEEMFITQL